MAKTNIDSKNKKTVEAKNILVVLPNWVGDNIMATPTLRAIREGHPGSKITYLIKPYLEDLYSGCSWYDQLIYWPGGKKTRTPKTTMQLIKQLKNEKFDLAILLSNSFRSALACSLGKIPRRVGYDRDGRGVMLTDKLLPDRYNGNFLPISTLKYYLCIADYLACPTENVEMELFTNEKYSKQAKELLQSNGLKIGEPYALLNPGASFGVSKCWPADYYAKVGDYLAEKFSYKVVIIGGPKDLLAMKAVAQKMKNKPIALTNPLSGLGNLKTIVKYSKIMVTNDTGARHYAAAFDKPVVTIFGSTDPRWSQTACPKERKVQLDVTCGPCQKKTCSEKHHKCMRDLTPDLVIAQIDNLLLNAKV
jgi:lipopolysaccharide heptosyltransferase II